LISDRSSNHERAMAAVEAIEWRSTSVEIGIVKTLTPGSPAAKPERFLC
jgi:hypothetical protein